MQYCNAEHRWYAVSKHLHPNPWQLTAMCVWKRTRHLICLRNETAPIRLYKSWHVPLLRSHRNPPETSDSTGNTQPTPAPRWWAACRDVQSRPGTDRPHPHCPWWDAHHPHHHLHLSCEPSSHPLQQRGEIWWWWWWWSLLNLHQKREEWQATSSEDRKVGGAYLKKIMFTFTFEYK